MLEQDNEPTNKSANEPTFFDRSMVRYTLWSELFTLTRSRPNYSAIKGGNVWFMYMTAFAGHGTKSEP